MKQTFTLLFLMILPFFLSAQQGNFQKSFEHFDESRGDSTTEHILTLPYEETVLLTNSLNSTSGIGPTFNYYGMVVVVDQMNTLPSGDMQLVLRREDGRDFYGFRPTIKAVLSNKPMNDSNIDSN